MGLLFFMDQDELTFLAFAKLLDSIPQFLFEILESKVRDFLVFLKFGGKMERISEIDYHRAHNHANKICVDEVLANPSDPSNQQWIEKEII